MLVFPGTNGDEDLVRALAIAGFDKVQKVWFAEDIPKTDLIAIPGGFSYGDYLRPGAIAAFSPMMDSVKERAKKGVPILGICNGFQILIEAGILKGNLLSNRGILFVNKWVEVTVENPNTKFTHKYKKGQKIKMPCAHCAGMYFADDETLKELESNEEIVLRYANWWQKDSGENFNGSCSGIAGIVSPQGNVMGLMPHPERAVEDLVGSSHGLDLFLSILE